MILVIKNIKHIAKNQLKNGMVLHSSGEIKKKKINQYFSRGNFEKTKMIWICLYVNLNMKTETVAKAHQKAQHV